MPRSLRQACVQAVGLGEAQRRLGTEEPVGFGRLNAPELPRHTCSWSEALAQRATNGSTVYHLSSCLCRGAQARTEPGIARTSMHNQSERGKGGVGGGVEAGPIYGLQTARVAAVVVNERVHP